MRQFLRNACKARSGRQSPCVRAEAPGGVSLESDVLAIRVKVKRTCGGKGNGAVVSFANRFGANITVALHCGERDLFNRLFLAAVAFCECNALRFFTGDARKQLNAAYPAKFTRAC